MKQQTIFAFSAFPFSAFPFSNLEYMLTFFEQQIVKRMHLIVCMFQFLIYFLKERGKTVKGNRKKI